MDSHSRKQVKRERTIRRSQQVHSRNAIRATVWTITPIADPPAGHLDHDISTGKISMLLIFHPNILAVHYYIFNILCVASCQIRSNISLTENDVIQQRKDSSCI
ncbi:hypothetical protein EGR_11163 [Echinococcus granulosus]|uniref:Uncharacterized protein n=1 Tax=Echinococcus granulosus TaxID=6210 RepID=W6TYY4_ECHGR|nr:hypothetical protein EGR_11163 [Echinococcus granulosus]EUB53980.1 hypothetical protein EGR_11163 [Echinococcus granulosus]